MYSFSFPPPQYYNPVAPQAYYAQQNRGQVLAQVPSSYPNMVYYYPQSTVSSSQYYPQPATVYYPQDLNVPSQSSARAAVKKNEEVNASIWYINDLHGRLNGSKKFVSAAQQFEKETAEKPVDAIKISAGDIGIGADDAKNSYMFDSLRLMKIDGATLGNHEFDMGAYKLAWQIEKSPVNFTVTNLNTEPTSPLDKEIKTNKISRSRIIEKNGHKYGFLGTVPTDLKGKMNVEAKKTAETLSVDDINQAIAELQQEVDKLKAQGVDKIILASHMEDDDNEKIAKETAGIDVIVSGHSHRLLDGVEEGKNLFYGKDGKPVVITQAEKDGHYYGILNVTFNPQGEIIKVNNQVISTNNIPKSELATQLEHVHMGAPAPIAQITNQVESVSEDLLQESPISDLIADAMRAKTGADVAFTNMGATRGPLGPGQITDRDIKELLPYENELKVFKYSEKDIIDALKGGVASYVNKAHGPSCLQVSGLRYKIDSDYKIDDVYIQQKDGSWKEIDEDHPSENTFYTVAYDSYLEGGPKYLECMKSPEKYIKSSGTTTTSALIDYLKSFNNKPFELKSAGRIQIEPKEPEDKD